MQMRRVTVFLLGVLVGLAIWFPFQWTRDHRNPGKAEQDEADKARSILKSAKFSMIGAKHPIEDLFRSDPEALAILRHSSGIRLTSISSPHREVDLTAEEVAILKDAFLSTYAYAPACMCVLVKEAQISFVAPEGIRRYWLQYSGHAKIHAADREGLRADLSRAGKNLLLWVHDSHFPEDKVWRFVSQ
jgi:hypothetical protein